MFWVLTIVINGWSNFAAWYLKVLAYKLDKVTRVSPLFYFETVFTLLMDWLIFGVQFGAWQIAGICVILAMFAVKIIVARNEELLKMQTGEQFELIKPIEKSRQ